MKLKQMPFRILWAVTGFVLAGCASHLPQTYVLYPKASVNAHPARMLMDTGASSTVVFSMRARRLGLKPAGISEPTPMTFDGQSFTAPLPMFHFSLLLRLGFIMKKWSPPDGVVGWPEIRDNILVFDADRRTVRSVPQLPPETAGWLKLKVVPSDWLLLEVAMPDGNTGTIEVDTGSCFGVEMPPGPWKEWKAAHPKSSLPSHLGGVASFGLHLWHMGWADEIKIGSFTLTDVIVQDMPATQGAAIQSNEPGAKAVWCIGMCALNRMDLVVDAKNGFAYLHPKPPPGPPYPGVERLAARHLLTNPPVAGGDWTVADDVRLSGDNLFLISGNYQRNKENWAGALADFSRALEINPNNAAAYFHRGVARQIEGDFSGAVSDYDHFIALKPDASDWQRLYRQTLLWRLGRAPEDFSKSLAACKEGWAKTLALFLVDKLDEKALLAAAEKSDDEPVPRQRALASYYIGVMRLGKGDKAGARDSFRKCRAAGMKGDDEYHFAGAELRRLGEQERPKPNSKR